MRLQSSKLLGFALAAAAAGAARAEVVDTRELSESIEVSATAPLVVIVRNVSGSVRVTTHDGDSVEMRATETVRGDLRSDIDRARAAVGLVTEQEPGRVAFRVRNTRADGDRDRRWDSWDGYRVEYDIEVRVPLHAAVELATVNDGDVIVEDVRGDFTLANVNGAVRVLGARGSGNVSTVNGSIEAVFDGVPAEGASFKTVNGEIDVTYPTSLAADISFHTVNGDVFTDFEAAPLGGPLTLEPSAARGASRMRARRPSAFRIGEGGTRHTFQTVNGSVYVRKAKRCPTQPAIRC